MRLTHLLPVALLAQDPGFLSFPVMMVVLVALFWFMVWLPERKKRQQHQSQLQALKKNDRVVTIGGIYGTVTNVHREADEVTLKVDETTNTKLRVTLNAIGRVVSGEAEEEKSGK